MATARRNNTAMVLGVVRRNRRSLMTGTALQATVMLVLTLPAQAQPAPNARPAGGHVVAGAATISRTTSNTQVDQASQRAAINWRSFDVGSQQSVTFNQPSASAVALNRVTGPDPSQIAGRIDANGQIILVNQSGVNFYNGAQVNAAGVMVSAANISNANFMAGVMKFDQPGNPNAKIDNQGTITIKETGLAALVAPQVANSGTISAKLGHVVLAGAKTATLDLFGDGLLSLDVTNQVTQAPVGPDGKAATALVTNTGTIIADGGTVQLTARAADGIVQNLVQAGGTIRAATMGDQTGVVALNGVGGSIVVEGQLSAPGLAPGTKGGAIEVASNRDVVIAASAKIDASGAAGGGVAAIGTTRARAKGGPSVTPTTVARNVIVQSGATVAADATANGNGGNVTLLATGATQMDGLITVRGGAQGGDGGLAEVSGGVVSLTGQVDATGPLGAIGTLLLDPLDLFVSNVQPDGTFAIPPGSIVTAGGSPDAATSSWISPAVLQAQTANISLATTRDLFVNSPISLTNPGQGLSLLAGHSINVNAWANITVPGTLYLKANTANDPANPGRMTINAPLSGGTVYLSSTSNIDITIRQPVTSTNPSPLITVACDCHIVSPLAVILQAPGGTIEYGPATNGFAQVMLTHDENVFNAALLRFGLSHDPINGTQALAGTLTAGSAAGPISLDGHALELNASGAITQPAGTFFTNVALLTGSAGSASLKGGPNAIGTVGQFTTSTGDFSLTAVGPLNIGGALNAAGNISLQIDGNLTEKGGAITAGTLTGSAATATLDGANVIANLGSFTAPGGLSLTNVSALNIAGPVNVGDANLVLQIGGALTENGGTITAGTVTGSSVGTFSLANPANAIAQSSGITAANGDVILVDGSNLLLGGTHSGNNLFFEVAKAGGNITLGGSEFLGLATLVTPGNGRISLVADGYGVTGASEGGISNSITTAAGTVELAPFSPINISLLGSGGLVVDPALLSIIHTGGGTLDVGGFTNVPAGKTAPAASANSVTIDNAADLTGIATTLRLDSTGSITETGGSLTVANLIGSAGTFANLTQPTNQIGTLGAFSTTAGFALVSNRSLLVAGPVQDTGSASTLALTTNTGDITLTGDVRATNVVDLISAGAINQTGGSLVAGTLTGSAATFASLTQPTNLIGTLGAFSTTAGFALANNGPLLVGGSVQDTGGASTLALTTNTGDITLTGNVGAGSGSIQINSGGNLTQSGSSTIFSGPGGTVAVRATGDLVQSGTARIFGDTVNVSAGGKLQQSDNALITTVLGGTTNTNTVTTGGDVIQTGNGAILAVNALEITTGGNLSQTDSASILSSNSAATLSVKGGIALSGNASVTAPIISLTDGPGGIVLTGQAKIGQTGASIDITSAGTVSEAPTSTITANSMTSSGGMNGNVSLLGTGNAITSFGPFSVNSGVIEVVDSIPLTINGALSASGIKISATGAISLASNITTGASTNGGGAVFTVMPDTNGNSSFQATTNVLPLDASTASLTVTMPSHGGNVGLASLSGPSTDLVLNLGSGNASGEVNVGSLSVFGAGGQVNFTNSTVQGFTGSAAALAAQSSPPANPAYLVNGCEIGVGCIVAPPPPPPPPPSTDLGLLAQGVSVSSGISNIVSSLIQNASRSIQETNPRGVPVLNPMRDLSGGPLRDRQSDPDLLLPNVSEKDY